PTKPCLRSPMLHLPTLITSSGENSPASRVLVNHIIEQSGAWQCRKYPGSHKVGSVFTSTATQHGGDHTHILSYHTVTPGHGYPRRVLCLQRLNLHGWNNRRHTL